MIDLLCLSFLSLIPLAYPQVIADDKHMIVGGQAVSIKDYPYFAAINLQITELVSKKTYSSICGGAIIGKKWILTAAHCLWSDSLMSKPKVRVAVGLDKLSQFNSSEVEVASYYIHPLYTNRISKSDIALIQLSKELKFNEKIAKIALPSFKEEYNAMQQESKVSVVGFGRLKAGENASFSENLQGVQFTIHNDNKCEEIRDINRVFDRNLLMCAGPLDGSKDSCQGDSGGPLAYKKSTASVLLGLVSRGYSCATPGLPGIYTRVSAYLEWIKKTYTAAKHKNKTLE